jgi:hypothetical protein
MSTAQSIRLLGLGLALSLTVISCSRKPEATVAPEPAPVSQPAAAAPERSVLLTYYSGSVEKSSGGAWEEVEIGARLGASDSVRTGEDSLCDLQVGEVAVVRLQAETLLAIQDVVATTAKTDASLTLSAGSVLCKV